MRKEQLYQVAINPYQVAEKLLFVPDIVQSLIDAVLVTLIKPKRHDPDENINSEVDYGDHNKAIDIRVPFEYPAEKADNGIKTNTMKNNPNYKSVLRNIRVYKP